MPATQQKLFKESKLRLEHGGARTLGRAKLARPFFPRKWNHLCLKSDKAHGRLSFLSPNHKITIQVLIKKLVRQHHLQLGDFVIMKNHLHFKLKAKRREDLGQFLRIFTAQLPRLITGVKKGQPFGRFWEGLAYSRILTSAKEELYLRGYFQANRIETEDGYAACEVFLGKFRNWVKSKNRHSKSAAP